MADPGDALLGQIEQLKEKWRNDPACIDGEHDGPCDGIAECIADLDALCRSWQDQQGSIEDEKLGALKGVIIGWDSGDVYQWKDALAEARRICGFTLAVPVGTDQEA